MCIFQSETRTNIRYYPLSESKYDPIIEKKYINKSLQTYLANPIKNDKINTRFIYYYGKMLSSKLLLKLHYNKKKYDILTLNNKKAYNYLDKYVKKMSLLEKNHVALSL